MVEADPRGAIREGLFALLGALERRSLARPDRVRTNREMAEEVAQRGAAPELSEQDDGGSGGQRAQRGQELVMRRAAPVREQARASGEQGSRADRHETVWPSVTAQCGRQVRS